MHAELESLENEFNRRYWEFHPGHALSVGLHDHDAALEDFSPGSVEAFCGELDRFRSRAVALDGLTGDDTVERRVLLARLDDILCSYRTLRSWQRDPSFAANELSSELNMLLIYDFAPLEERLRSIVAKERQVPRFLDGVKAALEPTAPILRKYGLLCFEGALSLVRRDIPRAFEGVTDQRLRTDLADATRIAGDALERFTAWLRAEHRGAPERAYSLGRDAYAEWLAKAELITTPLDELEWWALAEIETTRAAIVAEAARIDARASATDVVSRILGHHPTTGNVASEARRIADDVHAWVESRALVTFPTPERVLVDDTPEFMRWSFGSMWTPGPFEREGVPATFYATDADPSWTAEKQEEHLTRFCYRGLENLAIHEAYPGHFIQALHQRRVASPIRRTVWWGVFGEGWAHYCEQMALEEGFADGAAEARIAQLQEALNRLCRFVNAIRLHASDDWDFDRGTRFFQDQAWLTEAVARAECERGSFDAFYLRYTLGKREILALREECRAALGARFDLRAFHDALLGCGTGPMPALRELTLSALGIAMPGDGAESR